MHCPALSSGDGRRSAVVATAAAAAAGGVAEQVSSPDSSSGWLCYLSDSSTAVGQIKAKRHLSHNYKQ